jgi:hypothetical protein
MAIEEFMVGNPPSPQGPWVEWDGSNETDVVEYLNTVHPEWSHDQWTYTVQDGQLVLTSSGMTSTQPPIDPGTWLKLNGGVGQPYTYLDIWPPGNQTGVWKTQDPFGRAPSIDYYVVPPEV